MWVTESDEMANKTLGTRQKMTFRPSPGRQDYRAINPPQPGGKAARRRMAAPPADKPAPEKS
jgi:hypothetical protein